MGLTFRFGDAALDTGAGRLTRHGRPLPLEPRAIDVLAYLVRRPGELVPHRELLGAIWGEATVTAHSLTQAISQLRRALEDDPSSPRFIATVHRRGYRWVAPVKVQEAAVALDASTGLERWRLPASTVQLIGREALIESVGSTLLTARVVVLVGPGGVGKTQLALEAARRVAGRFEHGALLIDLTAEADEAGVTDALARDLRLDPGGGGDRLDALPALLRDRGALLLLDNCERVVEGVSSIAARLLATCPGLHLLATSQHHLHVGGQTVVGVPPLGTPLPGSAPLDPFEPSAWPASVRLFVDRARAVNPAFGLTAENAGDIGEICRRLDGLPFAIELAAGRANVMAPAEIAQRLDERFRLLNRLPATQARHDTLFQALSWSTSLLPERARYQLVRLAVFSRGWTREAAEAVLDLPEGRAMDELAGLVDKSLVAVEVSGRQARFHLLDSLHHLLKDRLASAPDLPAIRDRHLRYFSGLGEAVDREIARSPLAWLRRIREEHANIRDALTWAATSPGSAEAGLRLCCGLRWAWRHEGNYREPREWLARLLERAPGAPPSLAGRAWIALGLALQHLDEMAEARSAARRGLALLPEEERWERAFGELVLAYVETLAGDLELADTLAGRAQRSVEPLGDVRLLAFALVRSAIAAGMRARHGEAVRLLSAAVHHLEDGSDPFLEAFAQVQLGLQHHLSGAAGLARDAALVALRAGLELDNLRVVSGGLEVLAYLWLDDGGARLAARLLGASARLREVTAAPLLRNFEPHHRLARARLEAILGRAGAARAIEEGAGARLTELLSPLLA